MMEEMTHELIEDMDDMQRMMYSMKPRCFSMCEPTELFFRQVVPQILGFSTKIFSWGVNCPFFCPTLQNVIELVVVVTIVGIT